MDAGSALLLPQCGENVKTDVHLKNAEWSFSYSGGVAFSIQPLVQNKPFKLEISEIGHLQIGFIHKDPTAVENVRLALKNDVTIVSDMRVYKTKSSINVYLQQSENGGCTVCFQHIDDGRVQRKPTKLSGNVWLVVYLQFGSVTARIEETSFHHVKGENILLHEDSKKVRLRVENPASSCCLARNLKIKEKLTFEVSPILKSDKIPKKYGLKIGFSLNNANDFSDFAKRVLTINDTMTSEPPWHHLLEMNRTPSLSIEISDNHTLQVNGQIIRHEKMDIGDSGICLIFELYRVKISSFKIQIIEESGYVESTDIVHGQRERQSCIEENLSEKSSFVSQSTSANKLRPLPGIPSDYTEIVSRMEAVEHSLTDESKLVHLDYDEELNNMKTQIESVYCYHVSVGSQENREQTDGNSYQSLNPSSQHEEDAVGDNRRHSVEYLYQKIQSIGNALSSLQTIKEKEATNATVEKCEQVRILLEQLVQSSKQKEKQMSECVDIQERLKRNCTKIVRDLELPRILDILFENGLVNRIDYESLLDNYAQNKESTNRSFMLKFLRHGKSFDPDLFVEAFRKTGQEWLIEL